ncbi:MAG TPA: hypothetical protein VHO71_02500 [Caproiciproducens sp.]|nr:hypothetical protein [Caproiciproducens sp.]
METKTYHCNNPDENPLPFWMRRQEKKPEEKPEDLVQQFKRNPDSFFPPIVAPAKPIRKK